MADMIKFYKGLEASLPASGVNGALYITTDEGAIYLGTGTGMKRLGDFVQVANVASLPEKAHESCLYYCVAENILAKWNGTEWKQINKQPTAEEMKTLLGLGTLAYKSEVSEGDLNATLVEKINASAEGNHSHANKAVLDGITAEKVAAWDASEQNAKDYADDLDEAMDTRVKAVEGTSHTHANKELLDTYTQTEANLADAVAKKHAHANAAELDKIVEGDKAKWDAVAADHLTSADKTELSNAIKEAKKAGTDANTNIETYKVANDARVLAVEEDIAEIVDGTNGILAQAKSYTDGKDSAMNTRVAALEAAAPTHALKTEVEAVDAKFANYNTTVAQKAIDDAQDVEIAKKVDKVEGKSLIAETEITRLAGMSDGANKVEASATNGNIKIDGVETVVYTHPAKHIIADIEGLQDALDGKQEGGTYAEEEHVHVKADITDFAHTHIASEITDLDATIKAYKYATQDEAQGYADAKDEAIAAAKKAGDDAQKTADDLAAYVGTFTASEGIDTVVKYIDAKTANIASDERVNGIDERLIQAEKDIDDIEDDYLKAADKTELSEAIAAEKERAEGIEGGLRTDVDAIKGDYLKAADKTELEGKITTNANAIERLTNGVSAEEIDGVNDLIQYVKDHGTDVTGMKEDIAENAKAISDHEVLAAETYETKDDAAQKLTDAKGYANGLNTAMDTRVKVLEAIDHDAYKAADATLKSELQGEIDDDVKVVSDALAEYKTANDAEVGKKANAADVYAKTETYTQAEVDAAIAAAVEAAHTWGSF